MNDARQDSLHDARHDAAQDAGPDTSPDAVLDGGLEATHDVRIGALVRRLPIIDVGGVSVALLNLLGDTELVEEAARLLAPLVPEGTEAFVTPEVKAVPLAHALSRSTGVPYVVVRKTEKPYMVGAVSRTVTSITTGKPQTLVLDGGDIPRLAGRSVVIVDDVVSTGGTLDGLIDLLASVDARVAGTMVVFTEGAERTDVIALGHLPLFPAKPPAQATSTAPAASG